MNLVLGTARREGPTPGVGPLPVWLLLLYLDLHGVSAMNRRVYALANELVAYDDDDYVPSTTKTL